jgi:uncharacterized protein YndB with AHSA1/START domain/DNA-binding transcriptional ArsR family regulator
MTSHTSAVDQEALAALVEPNRLRIVELLGASPRAVGEIAEQLGLRQPQVTKHLQTLQRHGLVTMHPLGQRRIYALRREPLRELRDWLGRFDADLPSEDVLAQYEAAIAAERARSAGPRRFEFERELDASPTAIWRAWTSADQLRRWFAPDHFEVDDCVVEPVPGGRFDVVLREGDGKRHSAAGRFVKLARPHALRFEQAPLGPSGQPLFAAVHDMRLSGRRPRTVLRLTIDVRDVRPEAAPAVAGIGFGWEQLLDRLATVVA